MGNISNVKSPSPNSLTTVRTRTDTSSNVTLEDLRNRLTFERNVNMGVKNNYVYLS